MMVATIRTLTAAEFSAVISITQDKMKVPIKCTEMASMSI